jgi:hypothetical protein
MAQRKRVQQIQPELSEKDQKIYESMKDDLTEEQRGEWMKRRAAEQMAVDESAIEIDRWYEKKGSKLILKIKKKSGGCCSFYRGNFKKTPEILDDPEVQKLLKG